MPLSRPRILRELARPHVVPTNDKLGRKHAEHVAKSLKAKSIKLIELPRGKDVWELIAKGAAVAAPKRRRAMRGVARRIRR
jgi:hypothetical protein